MLLPEESYIYEEILYEEYSSLGKINQRPPNIARKLFDPYNSKRKNVKNNSNYTIELITEEEALGMYI